MKRFFDLIVSFLGIIFFLPLMKVNAVMLQEMGLM